MLSSYLIHSHRPFTLITIKEDAESFKKTELMVSIKNGQFVYSEWMCICATINVPKTLTITYF